MGPATALTTKERAPRHLSLCPWLSNRLLALSLYCFIGQCDKRHTLSLRAASRSALSRCQPCIHAGRWENPHRQPSFPATLDGSLPISWHHSEPSHDRAILRTSSSTNR